MNILHKGAVLHGTSVPFKMGEQPLIFKVISSITTHVLMGHWRMARLFEQPWMSVFYYKIISIINLWRDTYSEYKQSSSKTVNPFLISAQA